MTKKLNRGMLLDETVPITHEQRKVIEIVENEPLDPATQLFGPPATKILSKAKRKELKEQKVLNCFKSDCEVFYKLKIDCGLDVHSQNCKKCDFETHSEGLVRLHKETEHQLKETFQNKN